MMKVKKRRQGRVLTTNFGTPRRTFQCYVKRHPASMKSRKRRQGRVLATSFGTPGGPTKKKIHLTTLSGSSAANLLQMKSSMTSRLTKKRRALATSRAPSP